MLPEGAAVAVKVCGLTTAEDAAACAVHGLWGIGVVFAAGSPREVDAATAAKVLAAVPEGVARVGVFVGEAPARMAALARQVGLTHLQVHGECDPDEVRAAAGLPVIQGIGVRDAASLERARASAADLVLLDAAVAGLHGGTGATFDWSLVGEGALGRPFGLAGGLRPENVAAATSLLHPALVDVSTGVERAPGRKDPELVRAFVAAVAGAGRVAA
jgi:phosphoribosylanthranilate isomerase